MAECRSCGARLLWAWTHNGKRIPLDAEPVEDGNVQIIGENEEGEPVVAFLRQDALLPPVGPLYVSHFATCPDAQEHRKK